MKFPLIFSRGIPTVPMGARSLGKVIDMSRRTISGTVFGFQNCPVFFFVSLCRKTSTSWQEWKKHREKNNYRRVKHPNKGVRNYDCLVNMTAEIELQTRHWVLCWIFCLIKVELVIATDLVQLHVAMLFNSSATLSCNLCSCLNYSCNGPVPGNGCLVIVDNNV